MCQNVLQVAYCSPIREQRIQVRFARTEPEQHVPKVGPRLQSMSLRTRKDPEHHRRTRAHRLASQKLPVLSIMLSSGGDRRISQKIGIREGPSGTMGGSFMRSPERW